MINFLYIDPGTGSMLFAVLLGALTTLYFVAQNLFIRLKTLIAGGSSAKIQNTSDLVLYSEGGIYWIVFKPIVDELIARNIQTTFYTSEESDPVFNYTKNSSVTAHYIGKGNLAYARLNLLNAKLVLMTTPGLDVYQLKRSKKVSHYAHLLHSVDDATSYRLFGLDYFDSVLLTGSHQEKSIRILEEKRGIQKKELPIVGCTYLDVYLEQLREIETHQQNTAEQTKISESPEKHATQQHTPNILIAPSWGASGILSRYGKELLTPLAHSGFKIIIRPHPQSLTSEADLIQNLQKEYVAFNTIEWDTKHENLPSLLKADILISDFSGIVFDYAFLKGGPILFALSDFDIRPYDASDIEEESWKFQEIKKIGHELTSTEFSNIKEILENLLNQKDHQSELQNIKATSWHNQGKSGIKVVDFIEEKLKHI